MSRIGNWILLTARSSSLTPIRCSSEYLGCPLKGARRVSCPLLECSRDTTSRTPLSSKEPQKVFSYFSDKPHYHQNDYFPSPFHENIERNSFSSHNSIRNEANGSTKSNVENPPFLSTQQEKCLFPEQRKRCLSLTTKPICHTLPDKAPFIYRSVDCDRQEKFSELLINYESAKKKCIQNTAGSQLRCPIGLSIPRILVTPVATEESDAQTPNEKPADSTANLDETFQNHSSSNTSKLDLPSPDTKRIPNILNKSRFENNKLAKTGRNNSEGYGESINKISVKPQIFTFPDRIRIMSFLNRETGLICTDDLILGQLYCNNSRRKSCDHPPEILSNLRGRHRCLKTHSLSTRGNIVYNDVDFIRLLGKGSFGKVFFIKKNDDEIALKVTPFRLPTIGELLARNVRHSYILGVLSATYIPGFGSLVEIQYGGVNNLATIINNNKLSISLNHAIRYLSQISLALYYCHSEKILHLDVKPANIIISDDMQIAKLTDFGSARHAESQTTCTVIGTVAYMAPELFCNRRAYCSADIYSLGVTAWHLLGGKAPYVNDSTDAIIYQVVSQQRRPQPELPPPLSRWQHIIENCWHQCPDERLTAKQLANQLQHGRDSTINISKLTFHN